jgi:hypothetical protein
MAIFLIALATWLAIRAQGKASELFLVATGLALAFADATKYASALWTPVVIVLVGLTAPQGGWLRPTFRACRVATYAAAPLVLALFTFGGESYVRGIMFTTLARQAGGTYASVLTVLGDSFSWIGIVFILAVIGTTVSFFTTSGRTRWLCATLTTAVLLAPLHQAHIHTTTSLRKHVIFGAWFGAIVAGYLLSKAAEVSAADVIKDKGWRIGAVAVGIELCIAMPQTTSMVVYGWPNTAQMNVDLAKVIPKYGCPCLVAEQSQLRYYLPQLASDNIIGPYSFWYWNRATHRELLHGLPAYEQPIKDHYFSVVEMDPAENIAIYEPIVRTITATAGYHREASIQIDHWGRKTMQVWTYDGTRSA